jgi:hypothetical protein
VLDRRDNIGADGSDELRIPADIARLASYPDAGR